MSRLVKTAFVLSFAATPAFSGTIVIDEFLNGQVNGDPIKGFIGNDPGPGGLPNVAIYPLPFAGVVGDVLLAGVSDGGDLLLRQRADIRRSCRYAWAAVSVV